MNDSNQVIWIKTSLVEESISSTKSNLISSRSTRRLNDDRFLEDEEENNDWGWIKGEVINEQMEDVHDGNDNDASLTILIKDEESAYDGCEVTNISSKEYQNGNILIANIHKDDSNDNNNNFNNSSSSLESEEEYSYPNDLNNLIHLHEPAILHVIRKRYEYDEIYTTASDTILVALNPFKHYNDLYSIQTMKEYYHQGCNRSSNSSSDDQDLLTPHVFSIADNAYRIMKHKLNDMSSPLSLENKTTACADQSILVSGESGAGKTVSTKYIMKYLATLSHFELSSLDNDNHNHNHGKKMSQNKNQVEQQVLQSNPILESFGNARTVRNDNSSRFGKFIEIQFTQNNNNKGSTQTQILGANIETYLLEKVRLITQSNNERNFHIFYEILQGFTEEQRTTYFLSDFGCNDFNMLLSQSDTYTRRDGIDDIDTFDELIHAFESMVGDSKNVVKSGGFSNDDINNIFTVTSLCLHLSNIEIIPNTDNNNEDGSKVLNSDQEDDNIHLKAVLSLLGVTYEQFNEAICYFSIIAGKEHHKRSMNVNKAQRAIHGLIKACYGSLFTFLVQRINSSFIVSSSSSLKTSIVPAAPTTPTSTPRQQSRRSSSKSKSSNNTNTAFIGILDIFGFESFVINSFEQLCINYCNEALQNQFNTFIFQQEQQLYDVEGIKWDFITFPDNKDVLTLLDSKLYANIKEHGLFQILDDQCRAPGTSDKSFSTEIYRKLQNKKNTKTKQIFLADHRQVGAKKFSINHYAGIVEYDILSGFVEKNKDEVPKETTELLDCSSNDFYSILSTILKNGGSGSSGGNSGNKVSSSPRGSLQRKGSTNLSSPTSLSSKSLSSSSSSRTTTGSQFRTQLQNLLSKIQVTTPHYIRCIKPNDTLTPDNFDCKRIVEQLRCAGVVEAIRISRSGYPHRYAHGIFLNSFKILGLKELELFNNNGSKKKTSSKSPMISSKKRNGRSSSSSSSSSSRPLDILVNAIRKNMIESNSTTIEENNKDSKEETNIINNSIQVGKTKVFCNTAAYEYIERKRKQIIILSTIKIQSNMRRYLCIKQYKALLNQILLENNSAIIIQKYWKMYYACDLYYKKVLYVIIYLQRIYRGNKQRTIYNQMLLISRTIKLQSYIRMLLYYKSFNTQKSSCLIIQCSYKCYKSRTLLHKLKTDAKDFQKVYNERNILQQEKLALLNELKEARELLYVMRQQKEQDLEDQSSSLMQSEQQAQSKTSQLQKQLSGINEEENDEETALVTEDKEFKTQNNNDNNDNNSTTSSNSSKAEQEKIITYCTNILSQQLLTSVVKENEQLHKDMDQKQKLYNDYMKIKEDAKKLKGNLDESKINQEKLQNEILTLMQERENKSESATNSNDDNVENVVDGSIEKNNNVDSLATVKNDDKEDKTAITIAALQEEIKKLKERDAINALQLDKLSKNQNDNNKKYHNMPHDSDDDDSDSCESYEERIIAANAIYNSDGSSASSRFFLEKEPFIPPDIYLPSSATNDNTDNVTTSTPGSKKNMFVNKFNNDELSQYDDLSLGFNSSVFISPPINDNTVDNNGNNRSRSYSDNIRPNNNQNKSSSSFHSSNYNSLQQTTRYSDLRKESSNGCSLPIISSTGAISEQSSESSTASCITALTNQLDLANDEISDLKAKLIYYKGKDNKKYVDSSSDDDDNDSDNFFTKKSQDLLSHTASSTTSENSNNSNNIDNDEDSMIKSDVPRSIEVDTSLKCEKLEQQIAHLERRLDNMSLVSSRTGRRSRGGGSRHSSSYGNNSMFDEDDILSYRERGTMSATRSTVAVDDISFSVPSSINNEQVIHQLLSDNDYIRNAVKSHMDEYSRNNPNLPSENTYQDNNNNERNIDGNNTKTNEKSSVTYPAVDCRLGRFFRSFVRSNGGATGPSSGQSAAYSSAYMR